MKEVEIFDWKVESLGGKYRGKTILAFFTYKEARKVKDNEEQLRVLQRQWMEEGRKSELRFCLNDGTQSELYTTDHPIKSINYVIGEKDYIQLLEEKWTGGGVTISATLD